MKKIALFAVVALALAGFTGTAAAETSFHAKKQGRVFMQPKTEKTDLGNIQPAAGDDLVVDEKTEEASVSPQIDALQDRLQLPRRQVR